MSPVKAPLLALLGRRLDVPEEVSQMSPQPLQPLYPQKAVDKSGPALGRRQPHLKPSLSHELGSAGVI